MKDVLRAVGISFVSSLLLAITLTSGGAAAAVGQSQAQTQASPLKVCYELENSNNDWLDTDQGCDNQLIAPSGGIYGLAVTLPGTDRYHVLYQVYSDGKWTDIFRDGNEATLSKPVTAIRIKLSPREKRHIIYTVFSTDAAGTETRHVAQDNAIAGNTTDTLTKIQIKTTA